VLEAAKQRFTADASSANAFNTIGATAPDASIDPVELASWTVVANTLLNLDETISKR
jgi:NAD-dependent DNA ligase